MPNTGPRLRVLSNARGGRREGSSQASLVDTRPPQSERGPRDLQVEATSQKDVGGNPLNTLVVGVSAHRSRLRYWQHGGKRADCSILAPRSEVRSRVPHEAVVTAARRRRTPDERRPGPNRLRGAFASRLCPSGSRVQLSRRVPSSGSRGEKTPDTLDRSRTARRDARSRRCGERQEDNAGPRE